jgi:hypothetical protein
MSTTDTFARDLAAAWQAPAASPDAVARLMAQVDRQTQNPSDTAQKSVRHVNRVFLLSAAAASVAVLLVWSSFNRAPATPNPAQEIAQAEPLDEVALSFIFSDHTEEELL